MDAILLHHCCAPCSPLAASILSADYSIQSFWFNPNIHPADEYEKRKASLVEFTQKQGFKLYFGPDYSEEKWIENALCENIPETEFNPNFAIGFRSETKKAEIFTHKKVREYFTVFKDFFRSKNEGIFCRIQNPIANFGFKRCRFCYQLRLEETAKTAKKLGIKNFTTTLLSSPYQKHEIIKKIGLETAQKEGLFFVYNDFRKYFYDGKKIAREQGSYMQRYCGCKYSIR